MIHIPFIGNVMSIHPLRQIESILTHVVLNPAHVPHYTTNSRTLGTWYSPRKGWADIEVPNPPVDRFS